MKKGDVVYTPRFCNVRIEKVFKSRETAYRFGFCHSTYYDDYDYEILGKVIGTNRMIFAGVKKGA